MTKFRALELSLSFLKALSESDNLLEDYIEDEGITIEEYDEMLEVLKEELAHYRQVHKERIVLHEVC